MKTAIAALAMVAGTSASAQTLTAVAADGSDNFASEAITAGALAYDGNAFLDTWAPGDMFGRTTGVTGGTSFFPFAMIDESVSGFPGDPVGILSEFDFTTQFFGAVDTVNADNSGGTGQADYTWTNTGAGTIVDSFSVDVAAQGDFEASDQYVFSISVDGGATFPFTQAALFNGDIANVYTMDDGSLSTLNDPMIFDGAILSNDFTTFTFSGLNLPVTGDIVLRFAASTDGGSEAFAWNNANIEVIPAPASAALLGLGGLAAVRRRR